MGFDEPDHVKSRQAEATAVREKRQVYQAVLQSDWLLVILPILSIALWVLGLAEADPRDMSDLGLLSLFGPVNVAALVLLVAGVIIGLHRGVRERLLALQLATFLALIHATRLGPRSRTRGRTCRVTRLGPR